MIPTYQDFEQAEDVGAFVEAAIGTYKASDFYRTATVADTYDAQRNATIYDVVPRIYNVAGHKVDDVTASNNKLASNFFNRLNTQRCMYSLANGVSFVDPYEASDGKADETKEALGRGFDSAITEAGYYALIHGASYLYWAEGKCHVFKATEVVPLLDENDGSLRACIRFWQLDRMKPLNAVLYEADGYTEYRRDRQGMRALAEKSSYSVTYEYTEADGIIDSTGEETTALPVVDVYASRLKQSTLVGMREAIDAYDLVKSGFANDMADCAQIYWIVENYGGMDDDDLREFLNRIKFNHVANADTQSGGKVTPYTQDVPYQAREVLLKEIRDGLYEDFGALDVHAVAAGATNDHIDAAYQPLDENAADFERCIGDAISRLLSLIGIEDTPIFRRHRISNQKEQVDMLVQEAAWLDQATILRKLPNVTPDEANAILLAGEREDMERFGVGGQE